MVQSKGLKATELLEFRIQVATCLVKMGCLSLPNTRGRPTKVPAKPVKRCSFIPPKAVRCDTVNHTPGTSETRNRYKLDMAAVRVGVVKRCNKLTRVKCQKCHTH